jgi:hypothetical protein
MHRLRVDHQRVTDEEFRAVADAIQAIRRAVVDLHLQLATMPAPRARQADGEERRAA